MTKIENHNHTIEKDINFAFFIKIITTLEQKLKKKWLTILHVEIYFVLQK